MTDGEIRRMAVGASGGDEQSGGEYVMKLVRNAERKMPLALNQLIETRINTNPLGVHEPLVVQQFPVA